jgi:hypothetical protein
MELQPGVSLEVSSAGQIEGRFLHSRFRQPYCAASRGDATVAACTRWRHMPQFMANSKDAEPYRRGDSRTGEDCVAAQQACCGQNDLIPR